jgi:hypothetical protein
MRAVAQRFIQLNVEPPEIVVIAAEADFGDVIRGIRRDRIADSENR